jgi:two-component system phosphate regulon sensor histidine kinase PhoR
MRDLIIYFGLPEFVLLLAEIVLGVGTAGWVMGRWRGRTSPTQTAALIESLPYAAVLARRDGRVAAANAEARQLWGEKDFPARLAQPLAALVREQARGVCSLDAPSGLRLQARTAPLRRGLALIILEDLSARQRQEAFYRNFVRHVSHELKTPLTVIQGHVAAVSEGVPGDDPRQTSLRIVAQEAVRLTQLVDNLLLLSRLEMPDFALERRPVNLEAVVEDAILQLTDLAEAQGVALNLESTGSLPRILADRARLKQVFINLLDNAIKYNRAGGAVTVRLSVEAGRVIAQVVDTGEGIPSQDLPHVFEALYRVERRQGRQVEGSGLGLSIVQRIVEQHGGGIAVESRVGEGSAFTVTLPCPAEETVT